MIDPRKMRRLVRAERRAGGKNVGGVTKRGWAPVTNNMPAEVRSPRGAGETVIAGRLTQVVVEEIEVRGCAAVAALTTSDRIVDARTSSITWNIKDISNPDQRGKWFVFLCERGKADG